MKSDRTTKVLLLLIALGLWVNVLAPMFRPAPVAAAHPDLDHMESVLDDIAHDVHSIYNGTCLNKMCE
jgi:hypothetical protein